MNETLDEYHGVGGAYVVDPASGKRLPEDVFQERQKSAAAPPVTAPITAPTTAASTTAKTTKE